MFDRSPALAGAREKQMLQILHLRLVGLHRISHNITRVPNLCHDPLTHQRSAGIADEAPQLPHIACHAILSSNVDRRETNFVGN